MQQTQRWNGLQAATIRVRRCEKREKSININEEFLTRQQQQYSTEQYTKSSEIVSLPYACTSLYRFCFFIYHKICFNVKKKH